MADKQTDFKKLLVLSSEVLVKTRKRFWLITMGIILAVGALVPGIYFGEQYLANFLKNENINFSGTYLPTDLCKQEPFSQLKWCDIIDKPVIVNYADLKIRDTVNENYTPHRSSGGQIYAYYDVDPNQKNGQILSNNLRYEYAYNTIVNQILEYAPQIDPTAKNIRVTNVEVSTLSGGVNNPLSYSFVGQNEFESLVSVSATINQGRTENFNVPLIIFNNAAFYNNFFNFMTNFHQYNIYNNGNLNPVQGDQTNGIIMGSSGRSIVIPPSVWSSATLAGGNANAVNIWLYKYYAQNLNYIYRTNWQQFTTNPASLNASNNPLRNFILYAPDVNPLGFPDEAMYYNDEQTVLRGLSSILYNPSEPANVLPIAPTLSLNNFLVPFDRVGHVYTLFLPPQHTLAFYYQEFGSDFATFYNTLNQLIDFNGDASQIMDLVSKYPFVKDLSFAPFQQTLYEEAYNNKINTQHWYLSQEIEQGNATNRINMGTATGRMEFFYRYWSAINLYGTITGLDGDVDFAENVFTNPNLNLNKLDISRTIVSSLASGGTVQLPGGIIVNSIGGYIDALAREKMYTLLSAFNSNFNYSSLITNVPGSIGQFSGEVSTQDAQLNGPNAPNNIYVSFMDKQHGIGEEPPNGYYSPAQIGANINDDNFINNITAVNAYYVIPGSSANRNLGEVLLPYRINYHRQTFHFNIVWEG